MRLQHFSVLRFDGHRLQTGSVSTFHIHSVGLGSGHIRNLQCFLVMYSWSFRWCFVSSCWRSHDCVCELSNTELYVSVQNHNLHFILPFTESRQSSGSITCCEVVFLSLKDGWSLMHSNLGVWVLSGLKLVCFTMWTIRPFSLGAIFLRPHLGRLATLPWILNFLKILAAVIRGTFLPYFLGQLSSFLPLPCSVLYRTAQWGVFCVV